MYIGLGGGKRSAEKLIGKPMRVERLARLRATPAELVMKEAVRAVEVFGLMESGLA